jgi:hypothetical protein
MADKPVTYRDLRNTPGRVFERLAQGQPLPLVAEGETKAILLPVEGGDAETVLEAWRRGRALLALGRLQERARRAGTAALTVDEIDREVTASRQARRRTERAR